MAKLNELDNTNGGKNENKTCCDPRLPAHYRDQRLLPERTITSIQKRPTVDAHLGAVESERWKENTSLGGGFWLPHRRTNVDL